MTKTAVIFGGTGFVGRSIVNRLAQAGYTVRVPTRTLAHAEPLRQMGAVGQVVPLLCDMYKPAQVGDAVYGASVVVNCIGILAQGGVNSFERVQGELPGILARAASAAGVTHFIHLSAIGADANSPSKYARSKAAGEGVIRAVFPAATILRPSIVFGPDDSFFNRFARMAQLLPALPLIGGGHTRFQPVFVSDVAAAVMAAITRTDTAGKIYELGGPAMYTFKQLMQLTLHFTGRSRWLVTLPWWLAFLQGRIMERLPGKILTHDQVVLLQHDNVVNVGAKTLADLGVTATALEAVLPTYLDQYKPKGRF
jgi:NADH dehydrogenase